MKKILIFTILLIALTGCTTFQVHNTELESTEGTVVNMPNPASVHCEQNGNQLEIHTNPDGSQSGVCVFADGSTCDEWAYFRGECGPASQTEPAPIETAVPTQGGSGGYLPPETTEEFADWWGVIKSTQPGAQYDDYFERQDIPGQVIYFGIDSLDPAIQARIVELRDSGKIVHLYGTLISNLPDYNGSQVQVTRIEVEE